ncbi:MAG TPA: hypothetical protein VND64_19125 [Pirellulales bacterium]|nr:hypothetical protein [Pirellulales bacterium]
MSPTPSTRTPAGRSVNFHAALWSWSFAAPLVFFVAATAGCQSDRNSRRLPPEQELTNYSDETPKTNVDPRRMSPEQLEVRDGTKAIKDVEENGVKIKDE